MKLFKIVAVLGLSFVFSQGAQAQGGGVTGTILFGVFKVQVAQTVESQYSSMTLDTVYGKDLQDILLYEFDSAQGMGHYKRYLSVTDGAIHEEEWYKMSGWKTDHIRGSLNQVPFSIRYAYGGSLNGKGSLLSGLNVVLPMINIRMGTRLKVHATMVGLRNVGTRRSPVPEVMILLKSTLITPFKVTTEAKILVIDGYGFSREIK